MVALFSVTHESHRRNNDNNDSTYFIKLKDEPRVKGLSVCAGTTDTSTHTDSTRTTQGLGLPK